MKKSFIKPFLCGKCGTSNSINITQILEFPWYVCDDCLSGYKFTKSIFDRNLENFLSLSVDLKNSYDNYIDYQKVKELAETITPNQILQILRIWKNENKQFTYSDEPSFTTEYGASWEYCKPIIKDNL